MKKKFLLRLIFTILTLGIVPTGCGLLDSAATDTPETTPTAAISVDNKTVQVGSQVTIDANSSSDPQGEILTYTWTMPEIPSGSTATLSSTTTRIVTFTADNGGYYTVTLQVKNVSGIDSAVQTLRIDAVASGTNHPPVANAGADQADISIGTVAILDGSASNDADQDLLRFNWSLLSVPATSTVTGLTDADQVNAFLFPDVAGDYFIKLSVSDGQDGDLDFVTITAK